MKQETELTDEESLLVEQYGISCETRPVYLFEGYKYEQLHHALSYAKKVSEGDNPETELLS